MGKVVQTHHQAKPCMGDWGWGLVEGGADAPPGKTLYKGLTRSDFAEFSIDFFHPFM